MNAAHRDPERLVTVGWRHRVQDGERRTEVYLVFCDGRVLETHRCRDHGDVVPMPGAIVDR